MCEEDFDSSFGNEDEDLLQPSAKKAKPRLETRRRKVQHEWSHEQVIYFISLVEEHRHLWDINLKESRTSRSESWSEIINVLGDDDIDIDEVKTKWMNLRATYNRNLVRFRTRQMEQGANEPVTISWKYFNHMKFLEANDTPQNSQARTSIDLPTCTEDQSFFENATSSTSGSTAPQTLSSDQCYKPETVIQCTPSPLPKSPTPSTSSFIGQPILPPIVTSSQSNMNRIDAHGALCEYFAMQMRALPPNQADDLHFALLQTYMDFMQNLRRKPPSQQQVLLVPNIADEQRHDHGQGSTNLFNQLTTNKDSSTFVQPAPIWYTQFPTQSAASTLPGDASAQQVAPAGQQNFFEMCIVKNEGFVDEPESEKQNAI